MELDSTMVTGLIKLSFIHQGPHMAPVYNHPKPGFHEQQNMFFVCEHFFFFTVF